MYLIDETYFTSILETPAIDGVDLEDLISSIDKYVPFFLQNVLDFEVFEELNSYIVGGILSSSAPKKWLDLVDGVQFIHNNIQYTWQGLKYAEGPSKISILAHFVYYNHFSKFKNFNITFYERLAQVFNEFIEMYQGASDAENKGVFQINQGLFPEYYGKYSNNNYVTLVEFLHHKKDTYQITPKTLSFHNPFKE
jgi:hypothetical protein